MKISQEELKALVSYDPETGDFTFKYRDRSYFTDDLSHFLWNKQRAGTIAGRIETNKHGYQRKILCLNNYQCKAHRAAWLYMTGQQPPAQIDHKNQNATDNRWDNLRDAKGLNQKNRSMQRNNKSGFTGVSWSKNNQKWMARMWIDEDGKKKYKIFGHYESPEEASAVLDRYRAGLYDPLHGISKPHYTEQA